MKAVNLGPLFHDSNSKVWMVDKVIADSKNYAPRINMEKDVIIFYETGKCLYQPMRTLGDFVGKKGEYSLFSEDKTLSLYYPNERWDFMINAISEDTIVLKPTKFSDLKYTMVLVPFPEL
jgi:hypothetical protein